LTGNTHTHPIVVTDGHESQSQKSFIIALPCLPVILSPLPRIFQTPSPVPGMVGVPDLGMMAHFLLLCFQVDCLLLASSPG